MCVLESPTKYDGLMFPKYKDTSIEIKIKIISTIVSQFNQVKDILCYNEIERINWESQIEEHLTVEVYSDFS